MVERYNLVVKSGLAAWVGIALILTGCAQAPQNKDAVRKGVVDHLTKSSSGLDLASMDVEVTAVTFHDKQANATVTFRPKANPQQGMTMNYTLESEGKNWVVKKKAGAGGHEGAAAPEGAAENPHGQGAPPSGDLPPGHPPVPGTAK
jgi:hypothetical protein